MDAKLPAEARLALNGYLALLDKFGPQLSADVYITGSAVLGDWRPGRSDLDILTVTAEPLTAADLDALAALHADLVGRNAAVASRNAAVASRNAEVASSDADLADLDDPADLTDLAEIIDLAEITGRSTDRAGLNTQVTGLAAEVTARPHCDAVCVHRDAIGARPEPDGPGFAHVVDGAFHRDGYRPDPVLWATLDRYGLDIRGPAAAELGAAPDPQWLRDWNLRNVESYLLPNAAAGRAHLAGREPDSPASSYLVTWTALGPGRLHYTIATGDIISKTACADYTARLFPEFPEFAELLARTKAWRCGDDSVAFTCADALVALDLVETIAADAARL